MAASDTRADRQKKNKQGGEVSSTMSSKYNLVICKNRVCLNWTNGWTKERGGGGGYEWSVSGTECPKLMGQGKNDREGRLILKRTVIQREEADVMCGREGGEVPRRKEMRVGLALVQKRYVKFCVRHF